MVSSELRAKLQSLFGNHLFKEAGAAQVNLYQKVCVGDLVHGRSDSSFVGEISALIDVDGDVFALLSVGRCTSSDQHSSSWDWRGCTHALVRCEDILAPATWMESGGSRIVLQPPRVPHSAARA